MASIFNTAIKLDRWMLAAVVLLSTAGLLNLASAPSFLSLFIKQAFFLVLGFSALLFLALFDYRWFRSSPFFGLSIWGSGIVLLAMAAFGGKSVNGASNWLFIGPFAIGPIEIVKLGALIVLARYFAREHKGLVFPTRIFLSSLAVLLPIALALLQPDLGSAVILASMWFFMVLLLRIPLRWIVAIIILVSIVSVFAWNFALHDYQKNRLTSFIYPDKDLKGDAYQSHQAVVAVGAGGFFGRGLFAPDLSSRLNFLPESATDFAFASLTEQIGFVGSVLLLAAFFLLLWRVARVAVTATNNFSCAYAIGLFTLLFTEIGMNIGMNLGLLPVTGIPLPFVSYGGSHILTTFAAFGLLESIRIHQPEFVIAYDREAISALS